MLLIIFFIAIALVFSWAIPDEEVAMIKKVLDNIKNQSLNK